MRTRIVLFLATFVIVRLVATDQRGYCESFGRTILKPEKCPRRQPVVIVRSPCFYSKMNLSLQTADLPYFNYRRLSLFVEPDQPLGGGGGGGGSVMPNHFMRDVAYAMRKCSLQNNYRTIFAGPPCAIDLHAWYDIHTDYLVGTNTLNHGFLLVNPSVAISKELLSSLPDIGEYGDPPSDMFKQVRILNINGNTESHAEVLYDMLARKLQWQSVKLIELRALDRSEHWTQCSDIFSNVEHEAFLNNQDISFQTVYVNTDDVDGTKEALRDLWSYLKPNRRVIVVCAQPYTLALDFIDEMSDTLTQTREYGVILYGIYLNQKRLLDALVARFKFLDILRSVKVFTFARDDLCIGVQFRTIEKLILNAGDPENYYSSYLQHSLHCAMHHLIESAVYSEPNADELYEKRPSVLLKEFFKRYNANRRRLRYSLQRRAVDYLNNWTLLSFDTEAAQYIPVILFYWVSSADKRELLIMIQDLNEMIWASGSSTIQDSLYLCDGYPSFYPCLSHEDIMTVGIMVSILSSFVILLCVLCWTRIWLKNHTYVMYSRQSLEMGCYIFEHQLKPCDGKATVEKSSKTFLAVLNDESVMIRCVGVLSRLNAKFIWRQSYKSHHRRSPPLSPRQLLWNSIRGQFRLPPDCCKTAADTEDETSKKKDDRAAADQNSTVKHYLPLSKRFLYHLNKLKLITKAETNVASFKGIMVLLLDRPRVYFVYENCEVGTMANILLRVPRLSVEIRYTMAYDLIEGVKAIHYRFRIAHGHLRGSCVLLDSCFRVKILMTHIDQADKCILQRAVGSSALYMAPELLRAENARPTVACDMYSFGILLHQIIYQKCAFYIEKRSENMQCAKQYPIHPCRDTIEDIGRIIQLIRSRGTTYGDVVGLYPPEGECWAILEMIRTGYAIRPSVLPVEQHMFALVRMMQECWREDPRLRPSSSSISMRMADDMKTMNIDMLINMAKRLAVGEGDLEAITQVRTKSLKRRNDYCKRLLSGVMPLKAASALMSGTKAEITKIEFASVYFHGVHEFRRMYTDAHDMVKFLSKVYSASDRIASMYDVTPLHRVNDTLLIASGVLRPNSDHASELAQVALQIHQWVGKEFGGKVKLKSGINSGPLVCGVVGSQVPMYAVFGDTVNVASRMYSTSDPGRIQISKTTYRLLRSERRLFEMTLRGQTTIKGKGTMITYWLHGFKKFTGQLPTNIRLDAAISTTRAHLEMAPPVLDHHASEEKSDSLIVSSKEEIPDRLLFSKSSTQADFETENPSTTLSGECWASSSSDSEKSQLKKFKKRFRSISKMTRRTFPRRSRQSRRSSQLMGFRSFTNSRRRRN